MVSAMTDSMVHRLRDLIDPLRNQRFVFAGTGDYALTDELVGEAAEQMIADIPAALNALAGGRAAEAS